MSRLLALLVVVAACGDDGVHHLPDAPPTADARVDGAQPQPDAPLAPVTLTITRNGVAEPNIAVYFQAGDSTEISTTTTDANGLASAMMPQGGFVTAVDPFVIPAIAIRAPGGSTTYHTIKTFANVKPGDHLTLTDNSTAPQVPPITVTVNVVNDTAANPPSYHVYSRCGGSPLYITGPGTGSGSTPPVTGSMTLYNCGAGTTDFLVIDTDINNAPLNSYLVTNVAVADQGTVDLTGGTYIGVPTATFNITNAPAEFFQIHDTLRIAATNGTFDTAYFGDMSSYASLTGGAGSMDIHIPASLTGLLVEEREGSTSNGDHQLFRWGAAPNGDGSYTDDLTGLPLLDFAQFPAFDPTQNTVTWTTNPGTTPDLYAVDFVNTRMVSSLVYVQTDWTIAGAFSGASVAPPILPGAAAGYNAIAADTGHVNDALLAKVPGGYDTIRAHLLDVLDSSLTVDDTQLTAGTSGHFEVEYATQALTKRHPRRR